MQIGMKEKIIISILILTHCLCSVSCLKIHENHYSDLRIHLLKHNIQHLLSHQPTNDDHTTQIPEKVFTDLKDFVANDTEITNRIHAQKALSKDSADKVKGYFLQNKQFEDFTLKNLVEDSNNPYCLDGIKQKTRHRLYKIILDQLDFSTIFLFQKPEQEFTQDQINAIVLQLKTDKELRPYLQKCFGKPKV